MVNEHKRKKKEKVDMTQKEYIRFRMNIGAEQKSYGVYVIIIFVKQSDQEHLVSPPGYPSGPMSHQ